MDFFELKIAGLAESKKNFFFKRRACYLAIAA